MSLESSRFEDAEGEGRNSWGNREPPVGSVAAYHQSDPPNIVHRVTSYSQPPAGDRCSLEVVLAVLSQMKLLKQSYIAYDFSVFRSCLLGRTIRWIDLYVFRYCPISHAAQMEAFRVCWPYECIADFRIFVIGNRLNTLNLADSYRRVPFILISSILRLIAVIFQKKKVHEKKPGSLTRCVSWSEIKIIS